MSEMQGRATIAGHPIHPMLIPVPITLLPLSVAADAAALATGQPFWRAAARLLAEGGVLSALTAAVPGLVDYLTAPMSSSARRVATFHLLANTAVTGAFTAGVAIRRRDPASPAAMAIGAAATLGLVIAGWLGGELSYVHRVGVAEHPEVLRRSPMPDPTPARRPGGVPRL